VVILLHGWPYDIHSFIDVVPILTAKGFRVIIPHLRGYGTTRFRSSGAVRNGQQAVLGVDVIDLMDALKIGQATIGGFDWGARSACIVAALWPERCKALVSVSGYLIGNREAYKAPLLPQAELHPHSLAALRRWITGIMSTSRSTIIAGGWGSRRASQNMMRSSRCSQLRR